MPSGNRLLAVLNCFAPDGANAGQLALYAHGTTKAYGDPSLIRSAIRTLGCPIPHAVTATLKACDEAQDSSPTSRKTKRKASSSESAPASADAAE
jgi:hypothetical protein